MMWSYDSKYTGALYNSISENQMYSVKAVYNKLDVITHGPCHLDLLLEARRW